MQEATFVCTLFEGNVNPTDNKSSALTRIELKEEAEMVVVVHDRR
ncbi:unnamed protein product, partial [Ascophyllum nodosum]